MAMGPVMVILGVIVFLIGAVVGSFLNVCIYRLPWEKSVIWPASHCPRCWNAIAAYDNIPILGWLILRGRCRRCGLSISPRYPLVEFLVGLLFVAVFVVDVVYGPRGRYGYDIGLPLATFFYHAFLVALLVAATFIDYDLYVIPDSITVTGMIVGIAGGWLVPAIRLTPSTAESHWEGLAVGLVGLLVGGGLMEAVRRLANLVATTIVSLVNHRYCRVEAMGFGDVTLMAMIGAFLGWQAAVLTFFIGPFFGLGTAIVKIFNKYRKLLGGRKLSAVDREVPFGPYLCAGALALVLSWRWLWPGWAAGIFDTLRWIFWYFLNVDAGPSV
ncbi:prepilin peptidase [Aquisphaera insulae]|uniref:prepilin peptidase n=1 Tax=Aquisphaera insulae TaxID=2712864 RepID=UPI0013EE2473|nr:A24 family peptidase [Aquisphaera insulae]